MMGTLNERGARAKGAAFWAATLLALSGCAEPSGATSRGPRPKQVGLAHIQLNVDPKALSGAVDYEITGNAILRITGQMVAIPGTKAIGVVINLPAGNGYTVRVSTSVSGAGRAQQVCSASAMFDVSSAQPTELPLTLQCDDLGASTADGGTRQDGGARPTADAGRPATISPGVDAGLGSTGAAPDAEVAAASDAGASNPTGESCEACSIRQCGMVRNINRQSDCYEVNGVVVHGPAMGAPRAGVCSAFMNCAHRTGCGAKNGWVCYCGEGVTMDSCVEHGPVGVCRAEFEAAGEAWDPAELTPEQLQMRYTVLTAALPLLSCEAARCAAPCFTSRR